ncbi:FkbM family methyltransferase [Paraburkholderia sp. Ac-20340]|uniref:FkbM family methyltransferase n=1 Tax=Paraburkholderia sp. Ac-20340 TaxID=2703888 RepID=UPI00197CEEF2|nr:FkbM family methyltransferase [Paraburkholderia sp. Ac-20340]MBN3852074.1 FkbM family methyltransferase [Paraburkholderia sp. Ac-20340]
MKKLNNVLVPTPHGLMLVNRNEASFAFGTGVALLEEGGYDPREIGLMREIVEVLPPECVVLDVGANIGVHTLEFARACESKRGIVHTFEPQRILFQMLAGNVAMNNFQNVHCHLAAVGAQQGTLKVPRIDYSVPSSFSGIEFGNGQQKEFIGQAPQWDAAEETVPIITLDSLNLPRVDFMKIDVEGMEIDVLRGASKIIDTFRPPIYIEYGKNDALMLAKAIWDFGYDIFVFSALDWVATPKEDSVVQIAGLTKLMP